MNTHVTTAGGSPGLSRYFTDRKISTKIGIGFACVLAITATISGVAYQGFAKVSVGFDNYNQRVGVVAIARDADREFLAFRRYVREYAVSGDEADVAAAEKGRVVVKGVIAKALAEIKNPERLGKMKHIAEQPPRSRTPSGSAR